MHKILNKYDISYIIIGTEERNRYGGELNEDLLLELGDVFFHNDTVTIVKVS